MSKIDYGELARVYKNEQMELEKHDNFTEEQKIALGLVKVFEVVEKILLQENEEEEECKCEGDEKKNVALSIDENTGEQKQERRDSTASPM